MNGGMIVGGWEYVIAAYSVTLTVIGFYALSVVLRLRAEEKRQDEERS